MFLVAFFMKKLTDFNFTTNPFSAILGEQEAGGETSPATQEQGQPLPVRQEQPQTPQIKAQIPAGELSPDSDEAQEVDQLQRGQNPTRSTHLVKVMSALEDFVTDSVDKTDIMFARGLMSAVSRLMSKDQDELHDKAAAPQPQQQLSAIS